MIYQGTTVALYMSLQDEKAQQALSAQSLEVLIEAPDGSQQIYTLSAGVEPTEEPGGYVCRFETPQAGSYGCWATATGADGMSVVEYTSVWVYESAMSEVSG